MSCVRFCPAHPSPRLALLRDVTRVGQITMRAGPHSLAMWIVFAASLAVLLAIDLVMHRGGRLRSRAAAITWSSAWVALGLLFTFVVWAVQGGDRAAEYIAAYLVEKSLSLDNLFVFLVVFRTLDIPNEHQRSVLTWGVLGALGFRFVFIFLGVAVIARSQWVVYVFAAILLWGAVRMVREDPAMKKESRAAAWLWRHLPVTRELRRNAFFVREGGRRLATPLFVALCAVELTDIAFAVDSVPAALAISSSTFVVFSSNALAVLGLRSLYVLLEDAIGTLRQLHRGLAAVLAFAATKLAISNWIEIAPLISVSIVVVCIGASVAASLPRARLTRPPRAGPSPTRSSS